MACLVLWNFLVVWFFFFGERRGDRGSLARDVWMIYIHMLRDALWRTRQEESFFFLSSLVYALRLKWRWKKKRNESLVPDSLRFLDSTAKLCLGWFGWWYRVSAQNFVLSCFSRVWPYMALRLPGLFSEWGTSHTWGIPSTLDTSSSPDGKLMFHLH